MSKIRLDQKRHILKTLTWRIIASTDTFIISWLITDNPLAGLSISVFEILTKTVLYYLHERAWYAALRNELKEMYNVDINNSSDKWWIALYKRLLNKSQLKKES